MVYTILTTDSLPWSSKTQEWVFFFIVYWFGLLSLKANTISYNEFVTNVTSSKTKKPGFVSRSKSVRVFFCSSIRNKKCIENTLTTKSLIIKIFHIIGIISFKLKGEGRFKRARCPTNPNGLEFPITNSVNYLQIVKIKEGSPRINKL